MSSTPNRKIRITLAAGPFFPTPPAPTGAVQRAWYDLALRFARRGHDVTVIAVRHGDQPKRETIDGAKIIRKLSMRQGRNIWIDLLKDLLSSILTVGALPPADILITNSFWMPVVAKLRGKKIGKVYVSVGRFPKGQMKLYRSCERLHAVSCAIQEAIVLEDPSSKPRIRILPYPIATDVFVPPSPPRDLSGERTILYTGRIHPEKGIHLLIRAFSLLVKDRPWLKLRIVGPSGVSEGGGAADYVEHLYGLMRDLPVEIRPPLYNRQALADELKAAHYYCYPSLADKGESFGVAPLEAMATGLPVVVSNLACFRDFVEPGRNGFVFDHHAPDAHEQLASRLATLVDDPALATMMGEAATTTAARFGYEQVTDAYLADFYSLIASEAD